VKFLGIGCLSSLEDIQTILSFAVSFIFFGSIVYHSIYGCMFYMLLFNFVYYVFLLLCMFRSGYCVSLCCSVYCLCVNVYCTTATGCQTQLQFNKYIIS
jgi:hypothetical protein